MPTSKPSGSKTIFWWIVWIALTIGSFFVASTFWTPIIAKHFGSIRETKTSVIWVATVFGSWMVMLLPLIIMMYQKVDKAYEDARIRREKATLKFRSIYVEKSKRLLSAPLAAKLRAWPEAIKGGHLVTVVMKDGKKIPLVYVQDAEEILGIYNYKEMPFEAKDIADVLEENGERLPTFLTTNWLRLDGVEAPV